MKKIVIIIVVVLLVLGFGGFLVFARTNDSLYGHTPKVIHSGKKMDISRDDTLIVYRHSNFAWSKVDYGEIILKDGTRYRYNCAIDDIDGCVYKKVKNISSKDLKLLKKYGNKLNDKKISNKNVGNDMGETSISYIANDKTIYLKGRGDNQIDNNSSESKNILKILKKYNIYI